MLFPCIPCTDTCTSSSPALATKPRNQPSKICVAALIHIILKLSTICIPQILFYFVSWHITTADNFKRFMWIFEDKLGKSTKMVSKMRLAITCYSASQQFYYSLCTGSFPLSKQLTQHISSLIRIIWRECAVSASISDIFLRFHYLLYQKRYFLASEVHSISWATSPLWVCFFLQIRNTCTFKATD